MITNYDTFIEEVKSRGLTGPSFNQELLWLHQQAFQAAYHFPTANIVELGTLSAISACAISCGVAQLMHQLPDLDIKTRVFSVDNYADYKKVGSNSATRSYEQNVQLVNELGYSEILDLIQCDDIEYLRQVADQSLGMVAIDSWHDYGHVKDTLAIVIPKMTQGGIVCGHDFALGNNGVVYAVGEWYEANRELLSRVSTHYRNWWTLVRRP